MNKSETRPIQTNSLVLTERIGIIVLPVVILYTAKSAQQVNEKKCLTNQKLFMRKKLKLMYFIFVHPILLVLFGLTINISKSLF